MPEKESFDKYIAATKINIGLDKENNLKIKKGRVVEFDGTKAIIDGEEYNLPKLSSAIKEKWLVKADELMGDQSAEYSPQGAGIEVRGATPNQEDQVMENTVLSEEEKSVGSVEAYRENPGQGPQQQQQQQQQQQSPQNERVGQQFDKSVQQQGGVPVQQAGISTKADNRDDPVDVNELSQNAISNIEKGPEGSRKKQAFKAQERKRMKREIQELKQQLSEKEGNGKTVREGVTFDNEGVSDHAENGSSQTQENPHDQSQIWDGDAENAEVVSDEASTSQSSSGPSIEDKESRLALARQMVPNFEWDFSDHWKTKLKRLREKGENNPAYVCAAYAVESEAMKKHIADQFPSLNLE